MEFEIKNRRCVCTNDIKLVGDNDDYTAVFSFDSEWNNVTKTARFISDRGYHDVILSNDSCTIPALKESITKVGVYSGHMASTACKVYIAPSIKEDGEPAAASTDVYSQLLNRIDSIEAGEISDVAVQNAIATYLEENPIDSVSSEELNSAIATYLEQNPIDSISQEDISSAIETYMEAHPVAVAGTTAGTFQIVDGELMYTYGEGDASFAIVDGNLIMTY